VDPNPTNLLQPPHSPSQHQPSSNPSDPAQAGKPRKVGFTEDFRRFFMRGLAALLPTLITVSLLLWVWDLLWNNVGRYILLLIQEIWIRLDSTVPLTKVRFEWSGDSFKNRLIGVLLAILLIYIVGVFVGNLIGRTAWRIAERAVMRIPLIRAIYPAVKQVTDFLLAERKQSFEGSRVVAVHARDPNVWSIGLVTGSGLRRLNEAVSEEMLTVFIPSSPTAFSGYVVVVSRDAVVELPLTVEEAMRLLVSGGVIAPTEKPPAPAGPPMPLADVEPVDEQPDKAASSSPPPQRSAAAQLANP
jgi:uncharacterized membrane protein